MLKLKDKSLVLVSSIVMAAILIVIIGSMETLSYSTQKKMMMDDIEHTGQSLGYQLDFDYGLLIEANTELQSNQMAEATTMFLTLKMKLDAMTRNDRIGDAAIYLPEVQEVEDKRLARLLQSSGTMFNAGLSPGTTYEMPTTFDKSFQKALEKGESWTDSYKNDLGNWITYFKVIADPNGYPVGVLGINFDYNHVQKDLAAMLWKSFAIAVIISVITIFSIVMLIRYALKPLIRLAEVSNRAAEGDLTLAVPVRSKNEIGEVATSFNAMIANLRKLTNDIRNNSNEVASSAANMQQSAEQTSKATEEVTEAIQEVASSSETQLQSFKECQRAMGEMAVGIGRIAESTSSVSELASETNELASRGEAVIEGTLHQMQQVESNIDLTVAALQELKEQSGKIGNILGLISDVATQTNLLALNASIEAARAGEHGKGFAVVAVEIRMLAERSKESSEQIGKILNNISKKTTEAVSAMELSVSAARTGSHVSNEAGESFRTIMESIKQVTIQVQEVSAAAQQMSAGSEQVAASLDQLEYIAESVTSNSQRVAAASEEQLASMQEVASGSVQLRGLATNLNEAVGRFKT